MLQLKNLSSLEKIFPKIEPKQAPFESSFFKNENHSFQIAYSSTLLKDITEDFKLQLTDIPKGISVKIYHVKLIPSEYSAHAKIDEYYLPNYEPGLFPDLLEPLIDDTIIVHQDYWKSLWIELIPSSDVQEGEHKIKVSFYQEDTLCQSITHDFTVINAELPKQELYHTNWFHSDCICMYYNVEPFTDRFWTILKNYFRVAVDHGQNMIYTPVVTPPLDTKVGGDRLTIQLVDITFKNNKYSFDFTNFRKWIKIALEEGFEYIEISHFFTQHGAKCAPKVMIHTEKGLEHKFGWHTSATSQEYQEFIEIFVKSIVEELKVLNLSDKCIFHVSDEPLLEHLESYIYAKKLIKPHIGDIPLVDALSDFDFYQKGVLQYPVPSTNNVEKFLEAKVNPLWVYYCTGQSLEVSNRFFSMPSARNRIIAYQLYKYDVAGFLHWGYNFWNDRYSTKILDPFRQTDAIGWFPSGDAYLVYPGKDGHPLTSIRIKVFQQALYDLRAMKMLESLSSKEEVLQLIDPQNTMTFSKYPHGSEYILDSRKKINEAINNLVAS